MYNIGLTHLQKPMSRICQITGKRPMSGHNVSHSNIKTKRVFRPNLAKRRLWSEQKKRWISLRISNAALREIDKHGLDAVFARRESEAKKA